MEDGLFSGKVFGDFGTRLKCCVESSSDGDSDDGSSSSSESDEEDSGADDESDLASGALRLGGCGSSSICTWPLLRWSFAGGGASSLNFSGPSPWATSVGRLRKRKRAGGKAIKSEYAGTDDVYYTTFFF